MTEYKSFSRGSTTYTKLSTKDFTVNNEEESIIELHELGLRSKAKSDREQQLKLVQQSQAHNN